MRHHIEELHLCTSLFKSRDTLENCNIQLPKQEILSHYLSRRRLGISGGVDITETSQSVSENISITEGRKKMEEAFINTFVEIKSLFKIDFFFYALVLLISFLCQRK